MVTIDPNNTIFSLISVLLGIVVDPKDYSISVPIPRIGKFNTEVLLRPLLAGKFYAQQSIKYNRINLANHSPLYADIGTATRISDLLPAINQIADFGSSISVSYSNKKINFTIPPLSIDDIIDGPITQSNRQLFNLQLDPNSYLFIGTAIVTNVDPAEFISFEVTLKEASIPVIESVQGISVPLKAPRLVEITGDIYLLGTPSLVSISGTVPLFITPVITSIQGQQFPLGIPGIVSVVGVDAILSAPNLVNFIGDIYNLNPPVLNSIVGADQVIGAPSLTSIYGNIYSLDKPNLVSVEGTLTINKPVLVSITGTDPVLSSPVLVSIRGQQVLLSSPTLVTILGTLANQPAILPPGNDLIFYQSQSLDTDLIFDRPTN